MKSPPYAWLTAERISIIIFQIYSRARVCVANRFIFLPIVPIMRLSVFVCSFRPCCWLLRCIFHVSTTTTAADCCRWLFYCVRELVCDASSWMLLAIIKLDGGHQSLWLIAFDTCWAHCLAWIIPSLNPVWNQISSVESGLKCDSALTLRFFALALLQIQDFTLEYYKFFFKFLFHWQISNSHAKNWLLC